MSPFKRKGRKGYAVQYRDPYTLRLRQRQFKTKTDARVFEDHQRAERRLSDGLEADYQFRPFAERWLDETATAVRVGTARVYRSYFETHLIPMLGELHLREITQRHVRDLIVHLRKTLAKKTVSNIRGGLHACLESAMERQIIRANPAAFRSRSKVTKLATTGPERRAKVKAFTADQARKFLRVAPAAAPRHWMMFRVMLACGLRPGEGQGLQPTDLEFHESRIRLERAITPDGEIEACKTTEAGDFEYVDMPQGLAEELREFVNEDAEEMRALKKEPPAWLFHGSRGRYLDRTGIQVAFRRVLVEAKLPLHFSPKCLRHTYATQMLINGESVYYVSRQMRHSDIRITVKTYGSWLPAGDRAVADRHFARLLAVSEKSEPFQQ